MLRQGPCAKCRRRRRTVMYLSDTVATTTNEAYETNLKITALTASNQDRLATTKHAYRLFDNCPNPTQSHATVGSKFSPNYHPNSLVPTTSSKPLSAMECAHELLQEMNDVHQAQSCSSASNSKKVLQFWSYRYSQTQRSKLLN